MELLGLPASTLFTLFAIFGALTVGLYILKLRRRAFAIPYSPLWHKVLRDKEATQLFSQLKRILSLVLQLVLFGCLIFALGEPKVRSLFRKGRTVVVLVDTSASMSATDVVPNLATNVRPEFRNRLGVAKDEIKNLIATLSGSDRMLIAQMDAVVAPLGPMSDDPKTLEKYLDELRPTETRADFPRALRFAVDALRGSEAPEIVVVSDGKLGESKDAFGEVTLGEAKLYYVPIGKSGRNVGITNFSVRRYPLDKNRYEVMFEVENTSTEGEEIELSLLGDGKVVDVTRLRLKAGERLPRFYPNLSGASRTLEAKIARVDGSHDDLPVDDHAYALLPERKRLQVLVVTNGNTYLEAALLLDEYLDVTLLSPEEYVRADARKKSVDAIIFDGATPVEFPPTHALYLDPRGPSAPVKIGEELPQPGFDKVDRKHPTMAFTAFDDINIARGHRLTPQPGDRVVGASAGVPILVSGVRAGHKFVAMGFDVRESDLPLRIAWPVFLLNTINWFADEDAAYLSSFRTGDVWRIPAPPSMDAMSVKFPDGVIRSLPVREGRAILQGDRVGFYEVLSPMDAAPKTDPGAPDQTPKAPESPKTERGERISGFAANLANRDEITIAPEATLVAGGRTAERVQLSSVQTNQPLWAILVFIVAAIALLEWATYHKRVTV